MAGDLIRLFLVDDHAMVRAGLTRLLEGYADIELLGAFADGSEAVSACERRAPDVILMDLDRILSAVDAGACGYLLKDVEPDELVRGIRAAARGEAALAPRVAAQFGEATASTPP